MEILTRILGIILPVFIIIGLGYAYARARGDTVRTDMLSANRISMDVLMPLLIFTALAAKDFDVAHNATLIAAGVLISLGSGLLGWPVARLFGYEVRSFVPPMMYNNCGNMGLPLAVLAFGAQELGAAVALFMACNLVYFTAGVKILESGRGGPRVSFWQFLRNPVMIAMALGMLFAIAHVTVPTPVFAAMKILGDACIPLMLFSLGVRMCDISLRSWSIGMIGAIVCPLSGLIVAALLDVLLNLTPVQRGQMYLFASLPPAVTCFMMAEQYKQEPDKVASIVLLGNLVSFVFVPIGLWLGLPK
ncbi:MAG TPA: AEC family transporter [Oxalicibacterium sp.]|jgi:predicted permease|nr:AEC family transporter [Oxalicibacterium sp.]